MKKSDLPTTPLHQRIYAQLRREIAARYKPGDILESQNVLAERFEVSFLTIREALSILAEEGVIRRQRGKDTVVIDPAGGQHIAVVSELDIAHPRTSYHFRRLPSYLRTWLRDRGYRVRHYIGAAIPGQDNTHLFSDHGTTCPELIEDVEAGRVRGVAVIAGPRIELVRYLQAHGIPVVGQDTTLKYSVVGDVEQLIQMGVDYLVRHGRRKLAFMSWGQPSFIIRYARQLGLDVKLEWLRCDLQPAAPAAGWEEFREIWSATRDKPDGLLVTDDVLFGDALHAMIEAHVRIPEELLVVSHANKGVPVWAPFPVTHIDVDADAMAEAMGNMLIDLMEKREPAKAKVVVDFELVDALPALGVKSDPPAGAKKRHGE